MNPIPLPHPALHQQPPDLPEQIVTERLVVRPYRAGDERWYTEMSARNRQHLAPYEAGNPVMTIQSAEDAEAVLHDFAAARTERRAYFLGCFLKEGGAFVGQIYLGYLDWTVPEFALGYFADVEHTGRGYMTEAAQAVLRLCFAHLGARRVRLECDDSNGPSARLAERLGFTLEEHLHETHRWPDGSLSGTLRYTLAVPGRRGEVRLVRGRRRGRTPPPGGDSRPESPCHGDLSLEPDERNNAPRRSRGISGDRVDRRVGVEQATGAGDAADAKDADGD